MSLFDFIKKPLPPPTEQTEETQTKINRLETQLRLKENSLKASTQKISMLSNLIEASKNINSVLDLSQLLTIIIEFSQRIMNADAGSLMLVDDKSKELVFEVALGDVGENLKKQIRLPMGQGIAGWVAQAGEPLNIEDVYEDSRFCRDYDIKTGYRTKSMLCVPLKVNEKVIGVGQVINKVDGSSFSKEDLEMFSIFCSLTAVAIEKARMHEAILENEKMTRELEYAKTIQQSFLTHQFPSNEHISFGAQNISAKHVGGDLYEAFSLPNNRVGVVIGDVSGKGISAALYMARFISDFRFLAELQPTVDEVLVRTNNVLCERSLQGMFITLCYLCFDLENNKLYIGNGGHLPPITYDPLQKKAFPLKNISGPPLGMIPNMKYGVQTYDLMPGQHFVLYTDGIIEARNRQKEEFSLDRLIQEVESHEKLTSEELVTHIIKEVQKYSSGVSQHDDLTVVAIKMA
ncbi:MAG: GAF domain-containing SpoIIE family protein phosphatase [Planctomycetota bacterium]